MGKCLFLFGGVLSLCLASCSVISAEIPEQFVGDWVFRVNAAKGFPWWDQIKYPVKISIMENSVRFEDQTGTTCEPRTYFYDEELKALIFKHCLSVKSELAFTPFYKIVMKGGRPTGEVWTYKLLFQLQGKEKEND